jgi:hypothetical protein
MTLEPHRDRELALPASVQLAEVGVAVALRIALKTSAQDGRLDQTSERYLVDVGTEQLLHGKFYDFGKWQQFEGVHGMSLAAKHPR